jgi:DNA-binding CsgD family transcriptional regulator
LRITRLDFDEKRAARALLEIHPMSASRCDSVRWGRHGRESLIDAALEAIGRAAMVIDASGAIVEATILARPLLADSRGPMRYTLCAVVGEGGAEHPDWSRTPVVTDGHGVEHLVVARPAKMGVAGRLPHADREWGLTARQRNVLAEVAVGNSNKTIAATLGVSVRTVEVHLTAVFTKAGVSSRAELLVKLSTIE